MFHFVLREFYLVCYVVVLFVWFCSVRFGFVFVFKEEEYVSSKMSNVDIDMQVFVYICVDMFLCKSMDHCVRRQFGDFQVLCVNRFLIFLLDDSMSDFVCMRVYEFVCMYVNDVYMCVCMYVCV